MAKTNYINNWETWEELCAEWKIDPYEHVDYGEDLGGGNSRNYEYTGDTPKREE